MLFKSGEALKDRVETVTGRKLQAPPVITEDTSNYMAVEYGQVVRVGGNDYFITGETQEGRFGISEHPKFWVKRAVDLTTGEKKIIKLNFYEQFTSSMGPFKIKAFRNPQKEGEILKLVENHPNFMQGFSVKDVKGNPLRILEFIRGKSLLNQVLDYPQNHEDYFHSVLPELVEKIVPAVKGMQFLAENNQHHGDIRNDHIIIERDTGKFRWIDFDLTVNYGDYDIWSLGNILTYVTAKGIITLKGIMEDPDRFPLFEGTLCPDDALLYYPYRIANLRKVYPYIHPELNRILMRFSVGSDEIYYEYSDLLNDIKEALGCWPGR